MPRKRWEGDGVEENFELVIGVSGQLRAVTIQGGLKVARLLNEDCEKENLGLYLLRANVACDMACGVWTMVMLAVSAV